MTLETFFEKFELLADAPGAVGRMRELVLELAMRGRLVEQEESDGNADSIFGKTKFETPRPRFDVPGSWIWLRFADVGEQRLGKMLDQRGNRGDLKPYLRNTNVQWMRFELDDIKELRLETEELDEYRLVPGDLLICEGGEPGRCAIWSDPTREMYFQKAIHRVRPRPGVLASYLAICLRVDSKNGVLEKLFTGATIKHLTGRSLREYTIPLPPLAEQKRIVAKVEELMALCDRLEAQHQEREDRAAALARASLTRFAEAATPANLHHLFHPSYAISPADLRKAILTLAVQGKLVPQDPNDEPAEKLFDRIASTREKLIKQRTIKRVAVEANPSRDESESLSPGWMWARLGNIFDVRDGTHDTPKYTTDGFPLITSKNIYSGSLLFDGANLISEKDHRQISERSRVDRWDILFAMIGSIGNPVIVDTDREFSIKNVALFKYYSAADSEPRFLLLYLKSLLKNTGMENGEAFCWMARRDETAGPPPRTRSNEASRQKDRRPQDPAAAAPAKPLGSGARSSQNFPLRAFSTGS